MQSDGPLAATMVLRGDWQMRESVRPFVYD